MGTRKGCPGGVHTYTQKREWEIAQQRTERVTRKNDRIVGEGYAQRQVADTLSKVEKIKTEL